MRIYISDRKIRQLPEQIPAKLLYGPVRYDVCQMRHQPLEDGREHDGQTVHHRKPQHRGEIDRSGADHFVDSHARDYRCEKREPDISRGKNEREYKVDPVRENKGEYPAKSRVPLFNVISHPAPPNSEMRISQHTRDMSRAETRGSPFRLCVRRRRRL